MCNLRRSLTLVLFCLNLNSITYGEYCPSDCPDYYWRDLTGTMNIPRDAFVGAQERNGPLYVGQVFFRDWDLLPATIDPDTGIAVTSAYNHYLQTIKYVKILASPDNDIFDWIPIKSEDLHLHEHRAVPGGSEVNQDIFIGRVKYENEYMFGKIFRHDQGNKGLWLKKEGQPEANFLSYDLLIYNCNKTKAKQENNTSHAPQIEGGQNIYISVEKN